MLGGPPGSPWSAPTPSGTRDGAGAADHDQPFVFGARLTTRNAFPFSPRQFARLLCLRSHVRDGERVPQPEPAEAIAAAMERTGG